MKKIYLFLATAALFAACASDDLSVQEQPQVQAEEGVVGFDVYTQKAITRDGQNGSLTTTLMKTGVFSDDGFGVFGYYTDNNDYEQRATPNFFYNQQVTWNGSAWIYNPVKYWPNEYGKNAISDDADKVTYFAYAPWVEVIPTSGKLAGADGDKSLEQWGITGMTKNTTQGDPLVKYIASFNSNKSVDLCWGVADNNDGLWPTVQTDATVNIPNGQPWLNVQRPASSVDQKVRFTFKHATAQMRINIDAIVDEVRHSSEELAGKTRIWVREVKFKGFALKGTLNLNNDDNAYKPYWLDYNGQNELVAEDVIVYDGRKDGKEGVAGAIATNEKTLGLNPRLIQDGSYSDAAGKNVNEIGNNVYTKDNTLTIYGPKADGSNYADASEKAKYNRPGVTTQTVNLFAQNETNQTVDGKDDIFHVIPVDENFEVEIVYDVETVSENLAQNLSDGATKGSSIENRIRKTITFSDDATGKKLQPGHSYTLNLHLGMNSVEFDAAVTDWIVETAQDVDLPLNAPVFGADVPAPTKNATIPFDATKYTFAISGLDGGESVTAAIGDCESQVKSDVTDATGTTSLGWDKTNAEKNVGTNGVAIEELTTAVNPTTCNRTQVVTWTGSQSGKGVQITFTQLAHPIQIYAGASYGDPNEVTYAASTKKIVLKSNIGTLSYGWMCKGLEDNCAALNDANDGTDHFIAVKRNGISLTRVAAGDVASTADSFSFGDNSGEIILKDDVQKGDVYEVTLKTGDAPAETISIKIVAAP